MRFFKTLLPLLIWPLLLLAEGVQPKLIYLTPEPLPGTLYVGQTVALTFNAVITEKVFERIETRVGESAGLKQLGAEPKWERIDENRHRLTLYFLITDSRPNFPGMEADLFINGAVADTARWEGAEKTATRVASNAQYSGVLAEKLEVVTHKVEKFNEEQNILVMELRGELSNLERFRLNNVENQGIDWVDAKTPITRIFYYAIIPPSQIDIAFNYFKPSSGDFKRIDLVFDLSNLGQHISTHSDINPKKRAFPWMDLLLLTVATIVLIFFFFKTHRRIFLGMVAVTAVLAFWLVIREESIVIKPGAQVRLLPTSTSTLFYVTTEPTEAEVLKEKGDYYKVLLPDEKIGWVKQDEVEE